MSMPRFLTVFGALFGTGGVVSGVIFLIVRHAVYAESVQRQRGMFTPLLWQLSLSVGTSIITLSVLFGFLLFMLGRTLARVERLERGMANSGPATVVGT